MAGLDKVLYRKVWLIISLFVYRYYYSGYNTYFLSF